jgi:hypothetical protein
MTADLSSSGPIVKWSEEWWANAKPEVAAHRCIAHRKNGDRCKRVAIVGEFDDDPPEDEIDEDLPRTQREPERETDSVIDVEIADPGYTDAPTPTSSGGTSWWYYHPKRRRFVALC